MRTIDLRSDTVTKPSPAMWQAMTNADVGDDVFGEDPTVNRLEAATAELLGKEAGLYVASGTMGNLIAQLTHCGRGEEVIVGDQAHTYIYEAGGSAAVGGIHPRAITTEEDGSLSLTKVRDAVRDATNPHYPRTKLLILENTHNRMGGRVLPLPYLQSARALCDENGIAFHCDGARMWNAAVAAEVSPAEMAKPFDTLSVCLSKGLAAPVGSVVVGSKPFIQEARRARKLVGGGMRQAGIIAAAGLVALTEMQERLADDHANAKLFAEGVATLGYHVTHEVETNIVIFEQSTADITPAERSRRWEAEGLRMLPIGGQRFRAVTHYGIEEADIREALQIMERVG
jgi:threonine aldolase